MTGCIILLSFVLYPYVYIATRHVPDAAGKV